MLDNQGAKQSPSSDVKERRSAYSRSRTQYAAICFRQTADGDDCQIEILLITSRDSRRWVIPKGWPLRKKMPHQVASTEAWEEAGVRGSVEKKVWGRYPYLKKMQDGELLPILVDVHLLHVAGMDDEFPERKERTMRWFSPADAASSVHESELADLILMLDLYLSQAVVRRDAKRDVAHEMVFADARVQT
ncbi:MAG: NUDIX hydrolase [Agrobacterium tumefaciens]|nr:NUDIX hydrolase [Agrobacterium tumefaciens]